MTTVTMILSFLILLLLVIVGVENSSVLQIKFAWWEMQMPLGAVIFWAAVGGAAMIAIVSLPKLGKKYMEARRLHKEVRKLEKLCTEPRQEGRGE
jgi:uncharacterized integral membrane protein